MKFKCLRDRRLVYQCLVCVHSPVPTTIVLKLIVLAPSRAAIRVVVLGDNLEISGLDTIPGNGQAGVQQQYLV